MDEYKRSYPYTYSNQPKKRKKRQYFTKDIENLLYALGDGPISSDSTVQALDDLLVEFLVDTCHNVSLYAKSQGRTRIKMNDLVFALRQDPLKLARHQYIIEQHSNITKAKKMFDDKTAGEEGKKNKGEFFDFDDDEDEEEEDDGKKKKKSSK